MTIRRRALFLAGLLAAVSCSDAGNPLTPEEPRTPPRPDEALQLLRCTANVRSGAVTCEPATPSTGAAPGIIYGGQNTYVRMAGSNITVAADTFAFDATVTNLIPQPIGTANGTDLDSAGIRVYFYQEPASLDSGTVTVANASGEELFTIGLQPYFQYDEVLDTDEESAPLRWKFHLGGGVDNFTFQVAISTAVPLPDGWIDVSPAADTMQVGDTLALAAVSRTALGDADASQPTFAFATTGHATTVDPSTGELVATGLGTDTITVTATVTRGSSPATITGRAVILVDNPPVFFQDSVFTVNRVHVTDTLVIPSLDADAVVPVADTITTSNGGTAWIGVDSIVQYVSAIGFAGRDTVDFSLTDGVHVSAARLIVTVAEGNYWFVRPGVSGGDGRSHAPFATLALAASAADAGDTLFVVPNGVQQVDGGVGLKDGQAIIGAGIAASFERVVDGRVIRILEAAAAPGLTNTAAGPTITLGQNNTIRGVGITAGDGAAIAGNGFGTLTVSHTAVNPRGPALHLTSGTLDAAFAVLSSDSSNTQGLFLDGVGGTLTAAGGQIRHPDGTAFHVAGGAGLTFEYPGDVSNDAGALAMVSALAAGDSVHLSGALTDGGTGIHVTGVGGGTALFSGALALSGRGIDVSGNSGGSIRFTGPSKTLAVGANPGVSLVGNSGATIVFGGGTLAITGLDSVGFRATGGGTVEVTGPGNTISTGTGTALVLNGIGTGTSGVSFASVSNTGAANGIVADGVTGAGFQVTGTAMSPGAGGTIRKPTGHGIVLSGLGSARARLAYVGLDSVGAGGNAGLFAAGSDSIVVESVAVNAVGGPAISASTGRLYGTFSEVSSENSASNGVILTSMGGSFQASGGSITDAAGTGFAIAGGTVTTQFAGGITQSANNAALVSVSGGHTGSATFQTGTLQATTGTGLQFTDADGTYSFTGTTTLNGGDAGIDVVGGSSGTFTFGTGTGITSPTGAALLVNASAPTLTYAGGIVTGPGAGRPVQVEGLSGGSVDVTGSLTSTGRGILAQNNSGGTLTFSGGKTLSTGLDSAVVMRNNTGHAVVFANGNLDATTTTGDAIFATGGGTVSFTGAGSDLTSASGAALNLNGVAIGTASDFATVNVTAATGSAIRLVNVMGQGITVGGGTLGGTAGGAPVAVSGGTASLDFGGNITQSAANALLSVGGGHAGTLAFAGTLTASNGTGLQFDNADGTYQFTGTAALNGGDAGIDILSNSGGTFTFGTNVDITNPTGPAFFVSASAPTSVAMAGDIATGAASGRPVHLTGAGGTLTFSGGITSTGQGIRLETGSANVTFSGATKTLNTGANTAFQMMNHTGSALVSGGSLDIDVTSGTGLVASGGGTLQVTGADNTITAGTGTALDVQGTTIGASGLSFRSISHAGGANGIVLVNTGAANGLQVTGAGTAGSGGTIASTSGADGAVAGNGIYLQNVVNVVLRRVQLNGHANNAIFGSGVTNFTLDTAVVNGTNGNSLSGAFNEASIHFETLAGTVIIRQSTVSGGFLDNVYVANFTGSPVLNRLHLVNNTFGGTINQDGVRLTASVGTFNVTATGNTFQYWEGDAFDMLAQGSATGDLVLQNNTAHNGNPSPVSGSTNFAIGGSNLTYNVSNNSLRGAMGAAIAVDESGSTAGTVSGTIHGNQIGAAGVVNSGSAQGSGIYVEQRGAGTSTTRISGNVIRQINGTQAIYVSASDASAGGGNGTMNATVVGNNIEEEGSLAATRLAMNFNIGTVTGDAHQACLQIGGAGADENHILNFDLNRIRPQHRFNTTIRMPGYTGGQFTTADVVSYLQPRNDAAGVSPTINATTSSAGGGYQNTAGGAACPQPTT